MSVDIALQPELAASTAGSGGEWTRVLRLALKTARGRVGLGLVAVIVLLAGIGPLVAPHPPTAIVGAPYTGPSSGMLLGTDSLGRDVLSRVLCGGWVLLLMAVAASLIALALGTLAGIASAYLQGATDSMIMRTVDVLLAFPQLVFALLLVSILGPSRWLIVVAIGVTHFPQVARVVRSAALDISERDYVKASEALATSRWKVMLRDILPSLTTPLTVEGGLRLTYSIIFMAGLSFLGLGQQPPAPDWGVMINENRLGLEINAFGVVIPALVIGILTIGTNTFTDAVARVGIGVDGRGGA